MECLPFKGELKKGSAPLHFDRCGCHVSLDQVPAWVCTQCGEPLFEEKEVAVIQELIQIVEEKSISLKISA